MTLTDYFDFDLIIEPGDSGYCVRIVNETGALLTAELTQPFSDLELENFLLRMSRPRQVTRGGASLELQVAQNFGGKLYEMLFGATVIQQALRTKLEKAKQSGKGLRLRLQLNNAPALADLPWEYLYDAASKNFLALSNQTPLVRFLNLETQPQPLALTLPLKVICMIASPTDFPALDVEREWQALNDALADLRARGLVTLEKLETASLEALRRSLRQGEAHIFHFIGHGAFTPDTQEGALVLEDANKRGRVVSGQALGMLLRDHPALRLVVLNACESARTSKADPFSGSAQTLVVQGVPAVVAMQFQVTDAAALVFAQEFYSALADGYAVDRALTEARKAMFSEGNDIEWGTPVLCTSAVNGTLFALQALPENKPTAPKLTAMPAVGQASGVSFQAGDVAVGADVVGRDKIINIHIASGTASHDAEHTAQLIAKQFGGDVDKPIQAEGKLIADLESPAVVVRPGSPFYIERPADERLRRLLLAQGETITLRAGRQSGKTSLLMHGLHIAREARRRVLYLDFQTIGADPLQSLDTLLRYLMNEVAFQLDLDEDVVVKAWKSARSPADKFNHFLRTHVLANAETPIVIAIDKADTLIEQPYKTEFFALVRAWDSLRAYEERWQNLNIALVISTHPHLLIENINQSPFNVGTTLELPDFDLTQLGELSKRHGAPVRAEALAQLLGGHPFLVRQALYVLVDQQMTWADFRRAAPLETGPYGKHLRSYRDEVKARPELVRALKQIIGQHHCDDEHTRYRLLAAGLVKENAGELVFRCQLYEAFFVDALK